MSSADITSEELRASIREFLDAESGLDTLRRYASAPDASFEPLWARIAELGWLGLGIEERHGGLGLGFAEVALLCEELGRALTPLPLAATLLAAQALRVAGNDAQQAARLPAIATGSRRATLALPGSGALPIINGDRRITGRIGHVLDADRVHDLYLPVRNAHGDPCLAIIATDLAGVRLERHAAIDLTHTIADVVLDNVLVRPDALLMLDAQRWTTLIDCAAVLTACDAIGGATHVLERTVAYLGLRVQFDRPIGSFQALKHRECHLFLKRAHLDAVMHGSSRQHRDRLAALEFGDRYAARAEHRFLMAPPSAATAAPTLQPESFHG